MEYHFPCNKENARNKITPLLICQIKNTKLQGITNIEINSLTKCVHLIGLSEEVTKKLSESYAGIPD